MISFGRRHVLLAALIAALLPGCTVGPDFKPPPPPEVAGYTAERTLSPTSGVNVRFGEVQRFSPGADIAADWWHLFGSDGLDALVREALAASPTLTAAQAALRQAVETTAAQRGSYYPSVSAELSASRNLTPTASISPASASGNPYYGLITPQLNVAFVPDVFGANRRAVESLEGQEDAQRYALEASRVTLTTNIVAGAIQEASLRGQIEATNETIRIAKGLLTILRKQQSLGQAAGVDVATQETALAQAELALPTLRKQLSQQRDALGVLAGRLPSQEIAQTFKLDAFRLPQDLPVSLPSSLVAQRPDIRQSEANLHTASANIGQAIAARIPQVSLTAQIGDSASAARYLFTPLTEFWSVTGGVTQPLFQGFTLLHRQRAAEAAFDQAAAQYRSAVLTGFQNVADTLHALEADADGVRAANAAEQAAQHNLDIVRNQLSLGQVAYLVLLNTQNTYAQTRLALVQAQAARLADTAALFQALGGGWWHRADQLTGHVPRRP